MTAHLRADARAFGAAFSGRSFMRNFDNDRRGERPLILESASDSGRGVDTDGPCGSLAIARRSHGKCSDS